MVIGILVQSIVWEQSISIVGLISGMLIAIDSLSDETLNLGPLALPFWRLYEFPFGNNSLIFFFFHLHIIQYTLQIKQYILHITCCILHITHYVLMFHIAHYILHTTRYIG